LLLIENTLLQCKRVLKDTGSVFLHCDKTASHNIRIILDKVFGKENFQSEIVWSYKRWSNAKKGVPLSDVWEIPYLNPKAKERMGYPTQKPVLLLNQIINIATLFGKLEIIQGGRFTFHNGKRLFS